MSDLLKLQQKGLVEALGLEPDEIEEAQYNLLGFFSTLQDIEQRLIKEGRLTVEDVKI